MGQGESRVCSTCEKEIRTRNAPPQCNLCRKVVCNDCSVKDPSAKGRICLVCKSNKNSRDQGDAGVLVSKPKKFEKGITVGHDAQSGKYSGLPSMWREYLELELTQSTNEVDTSTMDSSIAPSQVSKRI